MCALLRLGEEWDREADEAPRSVVCDPRFARQSTQAYGRCAVFVCRVIDQLTRRVADTSWSIRVRSACPPSRPLLHGPDRATTGAGNSRPTRHGATDRPLTPSVKGRPRSALLDGLTAAPLVVAYHPG